MKVTERQLIAKRVVHFDLHYSGLNKVETIKHFVQEGEKRNTIYRILRRYEERGSIDFSKNFRRNWWSSRRWISSGMLRKLIFAPQLWDKKSIYGNVLRKDSFHLSRSTTKTQRFCFGPIWLQFTTVETSRTGLEAKTFCTKNRKRAERHNFKTYWKILGLMQSSVYPKTKYAKIIK